MSLRHGDLVAGRFRVEALAGSGGMGSVYRARDEQTGQDVALKVLFPERVSDVLRFSREAALLRELRHPSIVAYVAHGTMPTGGPYLAMEWARGRTLADVLQSGSLDVAQSLKVALAVTNALACAHRKSVVHRDIKPRNIMVAEDGVVKVLDFGIARARTEAQTLTRTGVFLGTPGYIAPEQARGEREVDARADIFSLGCVLFECLTGRPAFVARDVIALLAKLVVEEVPRPSELAPEVPMPVDALVGRMLTKSPTARPADAEALAREIEQILSSIDPVSAATWAEAAPSRLTEGELQLLSVVLATGEGDVTLVSAPGNRGTHVNVSLTEELSLLGIHPERLADGSVVCAISGTDVATDLAARAARCALALRRHLVDRPVVIGTGRGVMAGPVPAGEVIDNAVAMLRRVEIARDDDPSRAWIAIDQLTAGLLDATFEVRGQGRDLFLVGEREPLDVRRKLLGREAPFLGRDRELAFLESLFEECESEPIATAVVVIGNAGMGKSRLLSEMISRVEAAKRATVLVAKGDALAAQSPFSLVAQLVRRAAAILDNEPVEVKRLKLRARVLRHVPEGEADRVADFLGELASVRFPLDERPHLRAARHDPMLMREEQERAWKDFVAAECGEAPLLLVLEDLQWGDLPSVKLLELVLKEHRDRPLFVLTAGRPGTETLFPSLWDEIGIQELRLAKLSRSASKSMVRSALGKAVPEDRIEAIVARADGNAFYLEELIRAIAETASDTLPDTLVAMVNERLSGLDPEARRLLRAASVFGETFWTGGLRTLLGDSGSSAAVEHWLELLGREEIVVAQRRSRFQGQEEWAFRHALLREAAYASLIPQDRTVAHRAAGLWLEAAGESDVALLAEHFERGAEPSRAIALYRRAAETALEGLDLDVAMNRATKGITCGAAGEELGRLRIVQGEVHALRGENAEAERASAEVLTLVGRGSASWCWAAATTVVLRVQLGEIDGAEEVARELSSVTPTEGGAAIALVRACAQATPYLLYAGLYGEAKRFLQAATAAAQIIDPTATAALGWTQLAASEVASWTEGDAFAALRAARSALGCFRVARSDLAAAIAGISVGKALLELGMFDDAATELKSAMAVADRVGTKFYGALARTYAGAVEAARGEDAWARTLLEAAAEAFYRQGNTTYFGIARTMLAGVLAKLGDLEAAEREASEAQMFAFFATPALRAAGLGVLGNVLLARGRPDEALAAFEEAHGLYRELGGLAEGEARLHLGLANALEAVGRASDALDALRAAADRLRTRAGKVDDPLVRGAFLEKVPEHARVLALVP
ncbi:protein kinase [Myxococcota bacterium]|nr:protein kinase [Myxococcota bacterium]